MPFQVTVNHRVGGSSPSRGAIKSRTYATQPAERHRFTGSVARSLPVCPSAGGQPLPNRPRVPRRSVSVFLAFDPGRQCRGANPERMTRAAVARFVARFGVPGRAAGRPVPGRGVAVPLRASRGLALPADWPAGLRGSAAARPDQETIKKRNRVPARLSMAGGVVGAVSIKKPAGGRRRSRWLAGADRSAAGSGPLASLPGTVRAAGTQRQRLRGAASVAAPAALPADPRPPSPGRPSSDRTVRGIRRRRSSAKDRPSSR